LEEVVMRDEIGLVNDIGNDHSPNPNSERDLRSRSSC
jgi:hypothetical protein